MPELRSIEQIEFDNPGFGLSRRYDSQGVEYTIFYRKREGRSGHVHCRDKDRIQELIDRLKSAHSSGD